MEGKLRILDGDSFTLGSTKLRLSGIDAPEYRQSCTDNNGQSWPCGKAARAALENILREPGLHCEYEMYDRYGRGLAVCKTSLTPDVAAAQVESGMATSQIYYEVRQYGAEEDKARLQKRGLWRGTFEQPAIWRESNKRLPTDQ